MIKFGLYDAFSYTIPGGFYIVTFLYMGVVLSASSIDISVLNELVLSQIIVFAILSYITGLLLDPLARKWYFWLFDKGGDANKMAVEKINAVSHLKVKPENANWPILLAFVRNQQFGNPESFERFNATNIMLRNISFSLFLASLATFVLVFRSNFFFWNIVLTVGLLFLSILAAREAARFRMWFYSGIYQNIIAYASKTTDFIITNEQPQKRAKDDKATGRKIPNKP
jgi:hypothetical protein